MTGNLMNFTPEIQYDVIKEAVSHKFYRPQVNPTPNSSFHISDSLRYTNYGHNEMLDLMDIKTNYSDSNNYSTTFLRGNTMIVTKEWA